MSKRTPFLFFIILIVLAPLPQVDALGIGPPSFELDLQVDGSNSTTVYLLSDGLEGELIISGDDLPFKIDPPRINMSKEDNYRPVELTFYGNETLEPGVYEGKVTFLAYTGGFVAMGIKIRAKINLLAVSPELHHEVKQEELIEPESEEEPSPEDVAEAGPLPKEDETKTGTFINCDYVHYVMGGAAIAALVLIVWWKRR